MKTFDKDSHQQYQEPKNRFTLKVDAKKIKCEGRKQKKKKKKPKDCLDQGCPTCGPVEVFMRPTAYSNFFSYTCIFITVSNSMSLLS